MVPTDATFENSRPTSQFSSNSLAQSPAIPSRSVGHRFLLPVLAFQLLSCIIFVGELWSDVLGIRTHPIPYQWQEYIQVFASVGLIVGVVTSSLLLRKSHRRISQLGQQIDVARGNFEGHLDSLFSEWDLTPSEQDVTIYAMKGFSNLEIADFLGKATATVKSQLNAVYRKSGFSNRQQLISFLVEELLSGIAVEPS